MRNDGNFEEMIIPLITIQNYVPSGAQSSYEVVLSEVPSWDGHSTFITNYEAYSKEISVYVDGKLMVEGVNYDSIWNGAKISFKFRGQSPNPETGNVIQCDYLKKKSLEVNTL